MREMREGVTMDDTTEKEAPAAPAPEPVAAAPDITPAVGGMAAPETLAALVQAGAPAPAPAPAAPKAARKAKAEKPKKAGRPPVYASDEQRRQARRERERQKREKKAAAASGGPVSAPAASGDVLFTAADLNPQTSGGSPALTGPVMGPGTPGVPDPAVVAAVEPYCVMFVGAATAYVASREQDGRWKASPDEAEAIGKPLAAVAVLLFGSSAAAASPYAALALAVAMYAMPRMELMGGGAAA